MNNRRFFPGFARQKGTVLLVALIMLLVMTLLGLNSMRGTSLEERMAGNWRDQIIALQAAEAGLREAEGAIAPGIALPTLQPFPCPEGATCTVFEFDESAPVTLSRLLSSDGVEEWRENATTYSGEIEGTADLPQYLIEHRGYLRDQLGTGFGTTQDTGRDMFQITARGTGQTEEAVRILQSMFAKRYN
jgi:type IV pilus assembly protein PilX